MTNLTVENVVRTYAARLVNAYPDVATDIAEERDEILAALSEPAPSVERLLDAVRAYGDARADVAYGWATRKAIDLAWDRVLSAGQVPPLGVRSEPAPSGLATCQRCGRANVPAWSAPDDLWNEVMGGESGIVCPPCFAELTDEDHSMRWRFSPEPAPWRPPANDAEVEQARQAGWEPFIEFGDGRRLSGSVAAEKARTEPPDDPIERHPDSTRNAALREYESRLAEGEPHDR